VTAFSEPVGSRAPAPDLVVDGTGLLCVTLLLRLRKETDGAAPDTVVHVVATDAATPLDLPALVSPDRPRPSRPRTRPGRPTRLRPPARRRRPGHQARRPLAPYGPGRLRDSADHLSHVQPAEPAAGPVLLFLGATVPAGVPGQKSGGCCGDRCPGGGRATGTPSAEWVREGRGHA
jgi:tRNA 2-thiouridine synthesizing protein A